jgi:acyl-coenzyme A thioesterase PaaI-like protein
VSAPDDAGLLRFWPDGGCFGCSPTNASGLRMAFRRDGERLRAPLTFPDHFHGAPGVAHGGVVAAALDELSCACINFVAGHHVVTGELTVRYERPCPVERPLELVAEIVDRTHPRYWVVAAEVRQDGVRLARSTGKFFLRDREPVAP